MNQVAGRRRRHTWDGVHIATLTSRTPMFGPSACLRHNGRAKRVNGYRQRVRVREIMLNGGEEEDEDG